MFEAWDRFCASPFSEACRSKLDRHRSPADLRTPGSDHFHLLHAGVFAHHLCLFHSGTFVPVAGSPYAAAPIDFCPRAVIPQPRHFRGPSSGAGRPYGTRVCGSASCRSRFLFVEKAILQSRKQLPESSLESCHTLPGILAGHSRSRCGTPIAAGRKDQSRTSFPFSDRGAGWLGVRDSVPGDAVAFLHVGGTARLAERL